jgi:hypothetical protein
MANADNALLRMETGQQSYPMDALLDSGDATTFEGLAAPWSGRAGFEPDVKPDGVINGGSITPGSTADTVAVEAVLCNLGGTETAVGGNTAVAVTRATTSTHIINSVTIDDTGAIAVVAGTEGTSFSETRGAAGGPPYIPVGSIEIGQVRLNAQASALVTTGQIFQVVGLHQERYDAPLFEVDSYEGKVVFAGALPAIHTGDEPKGVYASYATPLLQDIEPTRDNVVPEEAFSVSSEAYYGRSIGSVSRSLSQGSFTYAMNDGITDTLAKLEGQNLWFEFLPNRYRTGVKFVYQGILGVNRSYPASGAMTMSCTVSASEKAQPVGA